MPLVPSGAAGRGWKIESMVDIRRIEGRTTNLVDKHPKDTLDSARPDDARKQMRC
jgi:hypothetical protein